jgi:pyruvate dehydrogenase E1 component alpha subunit
MAQAQTEAKPSAARNNQPAAGVTQEQALRWLRQMMLIRRFEERSEMMYQKGKIGGFFHQYSGQEPVAVGSIGALRDDDYVITAYRDHGHALARGMTADAGMAELLGKVTGCSKGKGGSMHFFDAPNHFLGGHAIVGSHIALAAGVAFAIKYRGEDRVCICYFGDGAMNQGVMHEAFNMASMWKLPVIYVCENNLVAMGTQLHRSSAVLDLTVRGAVAYGMPGVSINGNDVELMARATREAADRARSGGGPTFIEAKTYRFKGHSISDPGKYRTKEELLEALRKDPIHVYQQVLKGRGWLDDEDLSYVEGKDGAWEPTGRMWDEVKHEVEESIEFAERSEEPPPVALYEDITVAPHIPQE